MYISYDSDSNSNDGFVMQQSRGKRAKRQRHCTGGRSNSDIENLSNNEKLTALFTKLATTEAKVDAIYSASLPEQMPSAENAIKSHSDRITVLEYKSIDLEARSRNTISNEAIFKHN